MEEYNKHIERLKKINAITGDSEIAIITRGINDIVNSKNICEVCRFYIAIMGYYQ